MNLQLNNKTAIVCGSTQGIGKCVAQEMAINGANVVLVARNEISLRTSLKSLDTSKGQKHQILIADFTKPEELTTILDQYIKQGGDAHILVNNTGGPKGGPIFDASVDEFYAAFSQHLICNHILVQKLVPLMKKNNYGRIINIISTSVKQPLNGLGVSNTIRAAVANWSKTLANELGQFNITVNNVLPGATNTERLKSIASSKSEKSGETVDAVFDIMANEVPMKRIAQPEEIANAVVFLASEAASYINGINVPVDGGRTKSL